MAAVLNPINSSHPTSAAAVTPSDTVELAAVTLGLYIGGAGNVTVLMADGQTVTITAPPVGTYLPIRVRRVNATLTTATLIVAFW